MELLDVYNLCHERTGRIVPRNTVVGGEERLLVVHVCVMNSRNEMLVQKRRLTKDRYPGCWDVSAGGFVRSGEDSSDAVLRELSEELGLVIPKDALRFLFTEPFSYILDDFYLARAEVSADALCLQQEEVSEAKWASRDEILTGIQEGSFVDYPLRCMEEVFRLAGESPAL